MALSRLKAATPTEDAPVTMLELFFDLVFVFSVTQLTTLILMSGGWRGYGRAALVLVVTWWMYAGYAWLANNVGPTTVSTRLPMLVAMTCFLVMAIAVPDAFGSGAWLFAIGYLLVVLVHAVSFARSTLGGSAAAIRSILPVNLGTALLLVLAALVGEGWGWAFWVAACLVLATSVVRTGESGFSVRTEHFVERHQLLIIIALGETIIATGVSAQGQLTHLDVLAAVLLSMLVISCLWWVYFGSGDDQAGARALDEVSEARRTVMGMRAYSLTHLAHIAGLVLVAVGLHEVVHHPVRHLTWAGALTLSAGCALYLVGEIAFRRVLHLGTVAGHLVTAVACLVVAVVGVTVNGAIQLLSLGVVLLGLLLSGWSGGSGRSERREPSSA
jgi:low temperature requirement protein LtrA